MKPNHYQTGMPKNKEHHEGEHMQMEESKEEDGESQFAAVKRN